MHHDSLQNTTQFGSLPDACLGNFLCAGAWPKGLCGRPLWVGRLLRSLVGACHRRLSHYWHFHLHVPPLWRGATRYGLYQHATARRHSYQPTAPSAMGWCTQPPCFGGLLLPRNGAIFSSRSNLCQSVVGGLPALKNLGIRAVIRLVDSRVVRETVWSLISEQGVLDETSL